MLRAIVPLLFFFGQPFWEAKPPEKWTDAEIAALRNTSPWAQQVGVSPQQVTVFLATAAPIEAAEAELRLRMKKNTRPLAEPDPDYLDYLREHRDSTFVLGITYP